MNSTTEPRPVHQGRQIKRIREILRVKQSTLASELGGDWNQKKVSQLEDREMIEPDLLEEIAGVLKVPVEAIKNFDEESTLNIVSNTYNDNSTSNGCSASVNYNFNPLDKWVEALEENKRLNEENKKLYERLLQAEKGKVEMLERLLKEK